MIYDHKTLQNLLAGAMRQLGLTQAELADRLGVSHPTLKRWLKGKGLSFEDLLKLLSELGLTLADVAGAVGGANSGSFQYSLAQEEFFSDYPGHLAYFDLLLEGRSPSAIKKRHRLDDRSNQRYLRDLEKIGLIERLPREKVRLLVSGEPVWRKGGPLARELRQRALEDFVTNHGQSLTIALHRYLPDDARKISRMIEDIVSAARTADQRARVMGTEEAGSYGLVLGVEPFVPEFMRSIPRL